MYEHDTHGARQSCATGELYIIAGKRLLRVTRRHSWFFFLLGRVDIFSILSVITQHTLRINTKTSKTCTIGRNESRLKRERETHHITYAIFSLSTYSYSVSSKSRVGRRPPHANMIWHLLASCCRPAVHHLREPCPKPAMWMDTSQNLTKVQSTFYHETNHSR